MVQNLFYLIDWQSSTSFGTIVDSIHDVLDGILTFCNLLVVILIGPLIVSLPRVCFDGLVCCFNLFPLYRYSVVLKLNSKVS